MLALENIACLLKAKLRLQNTNIVKNVELLKRNVKLLHIVELLEQNMPLVKMGSARKNDTMLPAKVKLFERDECKKWLTVTSRQN